MAASARLSGEGYGKHEDDTDISATDENTNSGALSHMPLFLASPALPLFATRY